MPKDDEKDVTIHILPTAANLFGICFLVFSFIRVMKLQDQTLLDELAALSISIFLLACFASYVSIRGNNRSILYRKAADIFFVVGLILLTFGSLVIVLKILK